jgi:NAD(P)-dependent dehydrogenase (short-subunit alcohol dehydrogenase family)
MAAYSAAKGAIIALTHSLAFELAPDNIKVNCLCPGIVQDTGVWNSVSAGYIKNLDMSRRQVIDKFTAKVPLGRLAQIDDIVQLVRFLVVHGDYCTGQALNVSGGREVH